MRSALTYGSVNPGILSRVPDRSRRILAVGCGTGVLGSVLKDARPERYVAGITASEPEAAQARTVPGSRFRGAAGPVLDAMSLRLALGLLGTQFVLVATGQL